VSVAVCIALPALQLIASTILSGAIGSLIAATVANALPTALVPLPVLLLPCAPEPPVTELLRPPLLLNVMHNIRVCASKIRQCELHRCGGDSARRCNDDAVCVASSVTHD
jgi:hypothetical protein